MENKWKERRKKNHVKIQKATIAAKTTICRIVHHKFIMWNVTDLAIDEPWVKNRRMLIISSHMPSCQKKKKSMEIAECRFVIFRRWIYHALLYFETLSPLAEITKFANILSIHTWTSTRLSVCNSPSSLRLRRPSVIGRSWNRQVFKTSLRIIVYDYKPSWW